MIFFIPCLRFDFNKKILRRNIKNTNKEVFFSNYKKVNGFLYRNLVFMPFKGKVLDRTWK